MAQRRPRRGVRTAALVRAGAQPPAPPGGRRRARRRHSGGRPGRRRWPSPVRPADFVVSRVMLRRCRILPARRKTASKTSTARGCGSRNFGGVRPSWRNETWSWPGTTVRATPGWTMYSAPRTARMPLWPRPRRPSAVRRTPPVARPPRMRPRPCVMSSWRVPGSATWKSTGDGRANIMRCRGPIFRRGPRGGRRSRPIPARRRGTSPRGRCRGFLAGQGDGPWLPDATLSW